MRVGHGMRRAVTKGTTMQVKGTQTFWMRAAWSCLGSCFVLSLLGVVWFVWIKMAEESVGDFTNDLISFTLQGISSTAESF